MIKETNEATMAIPLKKTYSQETRSLEIEIQKAEIMDLIDEKWQSAYYEGPIDPFMRGVLNHIKEVLEEFYLSESNVSLFRHALLEIFQEPNAYQSLRDLEGIVTPLFQYEATDFLREHDDIEDTKENHSHYCAVFFGSFLKLRKENEGFSDYPLKLQIKIACLSDDLELDNADGMMYSNDIK